MAEAVKFVLSVMVVNTGASQPSADVSAKLLWTHADGPGSSRRLTTDGQQEGTLLGQVLQLREIRPHGQGLPPAVEDAKGSTQRCDGGRPWVKKRVKPVRAACNANVECVSAGVAQANSVTLLQC